MKKSYLGTFLILTSSCFVANSALATVFNFDSSNNQGWRSVGLYDDGGLTPIPGNFGDDPAPWNDIINFPTPGTTDPVDGKGAILLGSGGFGFPSSPTGDTFLHWDLNSPDLSADSQWQNITSFTYAVTGENIAVIGDSFVQAVMNVRRPDNTETSFTDGVFNQLFGTIDPTNSPTPWTIFTVDVAGLGIPVGSTITGLNLRFFFNAGSPNGHDGFFGVDNVTPVAAAQMPSPGTLVLLGTLLPLLARKVRR